MFAYDPLILAFVAIDPVIFSAVLMTGGPRACHLFFIPLDFLVAFDPVILASIFDDRGSTNLSSLPLRVMGPLTRGARGSKIESNHRDIIAAVCEILRRGLELS